MGGSGEVVAHVILVTALVQRFGLGTLDSDFRPPSGFKLTRTLIIKLYNFSLNLSLKKSLRQKKRTTDNCSRFYIKWLFQY